MLLADSCFNINHESFNNDLGEVLKAANNEGVEYFFCPASKESSSLPDQRTSLPAENVLITDIVVQPPPAVYLTPPAQEDLPS